MASPQAHSGPPSKLVITTATDRERLAVLGDSASKDLTTLVTGVGILNTALALGRTLEREAFSGVINFGLAGSFDLKTLPLGTICVVNREIWPEYGLGTANGVDAKGLKFPLAKLDGVPVWDRLELDPTQAATAMNLTLPSEWPHVSSLTVSTVSATPDKAHALQQQYSPALENMEGFALAYACALAGIPFLEIRCVSNLVGSRKRQDWDVDKGFTALGKAARSLLPWLDGKRNDG